MKRLFFLALLVCASVNIFAQVPQAPVIFTLGDVSVTLTHVSTATSYRVDIAYDSLFQRMLPGLENFGGPGNALTNDPYFCNIQQRSPWAGIQSVFNEDYPNAILRFSFDILHRNSVYLRMRAVNSTGASLNSNVLFFPFPNPLIKFYFGTARRVSSKLGYVPSSDLKPNISYKLSLYSPTYYKDSYTNSISACAADYFDPQYSSDPIYNPKGVPLERVKILSKNDTTFPLKNADKWYALVLQEQNTKDTLPYYTILPSLSPALDNAVESLEKTSIFNIRYDFQQLSDSAIIYTFGTLLPFSRYPDTTITQKTIDSVLTAMVRIGIPLKQVWFQEARGICSCFNPTGFIELPVPIYFAVELYHPDDRIKNFGAWERVKNIVWATSPASVPRKYVFRQTMVSVRDAGRAELSCSIAPNPSNDETRLIYDLPDDGSVSVEIFNVLQQRVSESITEGRKRGQHTMTLSAQSLQSGSYLVRLRFVSSAGKTSVRTLNLLHIR